MRELVTCTTGLVPESCQGWLWLVTKILVAAITIKMASAIMLSRIVTMGPLPSSGSGSLAEANLILWLKAGQAVFDGETIAGGFLRCIEGSTPSSCMSFSSIS